MIASDNRTKVTIFTGSFQIKGYIDLLPGARVTDFMDEAKDFVAVTDAEVREIREGLRQVLAVPFLDVSRRHIHIIAPASTAPEHAVR